MTSFSRKQVWIIWGALAVAVAMFFVPPVGQPVSYGRNLARGYEFVFTLEGNRVIDIPRLLIQYGLLAAAAWLLVATSGSGSGKAEK